MGLNLLVTDKATHRNGVSGRPFDVFLVDERDAETNETRKMLVVRFKDADKDTATCALDLARLADLDIAFGSNSWRGDHYQAALATLSPEEK